MNKKSCVILFSGGTDSTCTAALLAKKYEKIFLITFFEEATKDSHIPVENFRKLQKKYGTERFELIVISTDLLVQKISYSQYLKRILRYGFLMLSTPGFSSLSWHLRAIKFCKEHDVADVYDGMTQELLHFPGHRAEVRKLFTDLYESYGIHFSSPIINWPVPPDQRITDRLIVDRHGFASSDEIKTNERTTGRYLYDEGVFPNPNVKGSLFDHRMQHDCYPFVVFNIFLFWNYLFFRSEKKYSENLVQLFSEIINEARTWLDQSLLGQAEALKLFEKESQHLEGA